MRRRLGKISEEARPCTQRRTSRDPVRAGGRHLVEAQCAEIMQRLFEERFAYGVIAIDGLQVQAYLGHVDRLTSVGGGVLGQSALEGLVLGGRPAHEGERVGTEGAYGVAVDTELGVLERGGQFEVAEPAVGGGPVNEGDKRLACGDGVLEEPGTAGVPHDVLECTFVVAPWLEALGLHEVLKFVRDRQEVWMLRGAIAHILNVLAPWRIPNDSSSVVHLFRIRGCIQEIGDAGSVFA
ncbi:hypothetical protein D3C72_1198370 [compost metagenome]